MITITVRGAYFLGEVIMCNLLAPGHFVITCKIIAANDQDTLIEHSVGKFWSHKSVGVYSPEKNTQKYLSEMTKGNMSVVLWG